MEEASKDVHYFLTTLTSAFTLFAGYQVGKSQYKISQKRKNIRQLENNEILDVEELIGKGRRVNDVVLVKGNIGTKDGREVEANYGWIKKQKLAVLMKYSETMYSNDSFDLKRNNYVLNLKQVLKTCKLEGSNKITLNSFDKSTNKTSTVYIKNFDQKDYSKAVEILKWQEKKRNLSLAEHINVILLGLLRALAMLGSEGKEGNFIRGVEVGERSVDAGIKVGASISILGSIGFTIDGQMFVEAMSIFKDKLPELNDLRDQIDQLCKKRNFWFGCSVLGTIYLARRAFKYCKKNNIKIPYINP